MREAGIWSIKEEILEQVEKLMLTPVGRTGTGGLENGVYLWTEASQEMVTVDTRGDFPDNIRPVEDMFQCNDITVPDLECQVGRVLRLINPIG